MKLTADKWQGKWYAYLLHALRRSTAYSYATRVQRFFEFHPQIKLVEQIGVEELLDWMIERIRQGKKDGSISEDLTALGSFLRFCMEHGENLPYLVTEQIRWRQVCRKLRHEYEAGKSSVQSSDLNPPSTLTSVPSERVSNP